MTTSKINYIKFCPNKSNWAYLDRSLKKISNF